MALSRAIRGIGLAAVLASAGAAASWSPGTPARHHRVEIRELSFQPQNLRVAPGDTVSWVNDDIVSHTVTAADSGWDSGEVTTGEEFTWVAEESGTRRYVCRYHPTMTGNLMVQ